MLHSAHVQQLCYSSSRLYGCLLRALTSTSTPCSAHNEPSNQQQQPVGSPAFYRLPYDAPDPDATVGQRRALGKLEGAVEAVLLGDAIIRERLVQRQGFTVHRIRLTNDRRRASVLWDAHPGREEACAKELQHIAYRLRGCIAKALRSKHTPYLEFKLDRLPPRQAGVADALRKVEREQRAAGAATGLEQEHQEHMGSPGSADVACKGEDRSQEAQDGAAGTSAAGSDEHDAVQAAIWDLQQRMPAKAQYAQRTHDTNTGPALADQG